MTEEQIEAASKALHVKVTAANIIKTFAEFRIPVNQLIIELAAQSGDDLFLYDPGNGATSHNSVEELMDSGKDAIDRCFDDGWKEEVEDVCYGVILGSAQKVDAIRVDGEIDKDGFGEDGEYWGEFKERCNYRLIIPGLEN